MKVLLTGGTGFVASHIIDTLLERGHHVVFTIRSAEKGNLILQHHPNIPRSYLSHAIVSDISQPDAFNEAVRSKPPFEAVIHTASPFHYNARNAKTDILDPAVIGTLGILTAIKKFAPAVKRVVLTSSFAAMADPNSPPHKCYSESDWNPITWNEALQSSGAVAYRASKKFAESVAWDFVEKQAPNFTLCTINPGLVLGPVFPYLNSTLENINTSNQVLRDMLVGKFDHEQTLPRTGLFIFADVRDIALAHVKAAEIDGTAVITGCGGQQERYFCVGGHMSNGDIARILVDSFPEVKDKLPKDLASDLPEDVYGFDNHRSKEVLGLRYRGLEECVRDTVRSLREIIGET